MEKEVKLNGHTYKLRSYDHEAQTIIKNDSFVAKPGSDDIKVLVGTLNSLTVYFSLVDWDIKGNEGEALDLDPKLDLEGNNRHTLMTFLKFMPPNDMDELFVEASKLNRLTDEEKKTSESQPAE